MFKINSRKNNSVVYFPMLITMCWIGLIFYTIISVLPANPMSTTIDQKKFLGEIYPQGWGFYSKDPRSEMLNVYNAETYNQAVVWPNNTIKNVFGLYRYGRGQGIELGLLVSKIPKSVKWKECTNGSISCSSKWDTDVSIKNSTPNPSLCGELVITHEKLTNWAWSRYKDNRKSISNGIKVNVACSKKT